MMIQEQLGMSLYQWNNKIDLFTNWCSDEILHDNRIEKKSVEMNYHNYEGKIVEKYGVELKGWPSSKSGVCNPATLGGCQQLEILLAALESGQCHWVVLTEDELEERKRLNRAREERGEQVYWPRKSANHKQSKPKGAKSAETIRDEETDEEDDHLHQAATKRAHNNDEDEDMQEHPTKRSRTDGEDSDNGDDQAANADNMAIGDDQDNADNTAISLSDVQDNADNTAIGNVQDNTTVA